MNKIILIDNKWDFKSALLQYALKASKGTDTEIIGICPAADTEKETVDRFEELLKTVKQDFATEGVNFSSYVIGPDPGAFMKKIDDLMPASLVLLGDIKFSEKMVEGGVSLEALRKKLTCPVTTAGSLAAAKTEKKPSTGINWGKFLIYAVLSAIMYFIFYPMLGESLNEKIFMTGTWWGGLAIMVVVAVHAWVWGNTTSILPKLFKLEK